MDRPLYPVVQPLAQGGVRSAGSSPSSVPESRAPRFLWRPQTFRVAVAPLVITPLYPQGRSLTVALEIYADSSNTARVLIGNKEVTSVLTSGDLVPGNNYFQLDPGRHAYLWVDDPQAEVFDVGMYFNTQELVGTTQYLHCTQWQPAPLGVG